MALPGGGIVSVPLDRASSSSSVKRDPDDLNSPSRQLAKPSSSTPPLQVPTSSATGSVGSVTQADLLTVAAGEPVTHFNLDQLLEIVQSFQLDTTMASHDETLRTARDLVLCTDLHQQAAKNIPGSTGCDGKHCDNSSVAAGSMAATASSPLAFTSSRSKHSRQQNRDRGFRSSSSVIGCEASYMHHGTNFDDIKEETTAASSAAQQADEPQGQPQPSRLETHSCPSSPTETDCSSGFSTLRRRSVTVTEKIRTNKDGSKTQVVRQYGCNTSSANEPEQSVTYEKNSYVYINSAKDEAGGSEVGGEDVATDMLPIEEAATIRMRGGDVDDPFDLPRQGPRAGGGHMQHGGASTSAAAASNYRSHIVRLNSIEPNTVMFSTKDYPILSDISVPEIIDELEKQFDDKLCDLQGVRLVGNNVYICLSRKDSLNYLSTYGFYVRGVPVKVVDITHDSVVICLTGVPHYITDSTVTMLVSTFGIAIGEVERRFYKGIDTGERYVRLKPRAHTQVPDFVTVGGCKILIRVLSNEEVCPPYTLHSQVREKQGPDLPPPPPLTTSFLDHQAFNSQTTASFANSSIVQTSSSTVGASGLLSSFRAKPGHCNGTLNSPTSPAALPQLQTMSPVPRATDLLLTGITSATDNSDNVVSPKIAKSFRSRITLGLRSPSRDNDKSRDEVDDRTYVPGDPINDIPSLSPPPYKGPGSTGGSSTTSNSGRGLTGGLGLLSRITNRGGGGSSNGGGGDQDDYKTNTLGRKLNRHISKTDSSNSLASHKNEANGKASCNGNGNKQRSSVVFEEPLKTTTTTSHSSTSTAPPPPSAHRVATATNRTVNGILRKGSVPGDDIVGPPPHEKEKDVTKQRKPMMSKKEPPPPKKKSPKLESVTESGMEDGDSTTTTKDTKDGKDRSSRSRSSSSKTSSSKADKAAKDLALTRDLPWCGCWGNGCL